MIEQRYGAAHSAEEFAEKAQLAHYENTRAQFEDFAANGWADHKMTIYWMMNNHWPSFFGHIFDYYLKPGGAYFGAKMGLRPLSVVFDYYARDKEPGPYPRRQSDDARHAAVFKCGCGSMISTAKPSSTSAARLMWMRRAWFRPWLCPAMKNITPVYFVRCELFDAGGVRIVDNVYWQSVTPDNRRAARQRQCV